MFSEQLIAARTAKGMTQEDLARAVNVTRQTISSWERGRTQPDLNALRRLSDALGCDFMPGRAEPPASGEASAAESPSVPGEPAGEAPKAPGRRRWWIIAAVIVLACACLAAVLLLNRKPAEEPSVLFSVEYFTQQSPNEAGRAYVVFDNQKSLMNNGGDTFQMYDFVLAEQNGVGFTITRVEVQMEGKTGLVRTVNLGPDDLKAAYVETEVAAYGKWSINGGFPEGEFVRGGIAVYGVDATGSVAFYSLIEF